MNYRSSLRLFELRSIGWNCINVVERECQRKIVVIVWIRFKFNALLRFINTLIYSVRCIEHIILFDIELKYWASVYSIYRIDDLIDLSVYGWIGSIWTDGMSIEYTLILNIII